MPFSLAAHDLAASTGRTCARCGRTSAGHIMVIIGLVSMALGGLVIRKIVNFKY